ncbi:MAG: XdhC family protein [Gammaproteobacteria bacterium]|nr:XdhC family protein [Gammaproteobacteria bacterium]
MNRDMLARLQSLRAAGQSIALVTHLPSGHSALVTDTALEATDPITLDARTLEAIRRRLAEDLSGRLGECDRDLFVNVYTPPLRLILVGAVHVAQALIPLAIAAGYRVAVIDPRTVFATDARFPDVELRTDWPDAALAALAPDRRTAVVTLTHDPKFDDPALAAALATPAFYIGALGSRRTHAARCERLRALGVDDAALARIHAPVGLPLGGRRPVEIAIAILAEITQVLRTRPPA